MSMSRFVDKIKDFGRTTVDKMPTISFPSSSSRLSLTSSSTSLPSSDLFFLLTRHPIDAGRTITQSQEHEFEERAGLRAVIVGSLFYNGMLSFSTPVDTTTLSDSEILSLPVFCIADVHKISEDSVDIYVLQKINKFVTKHFTLTDSHPSLDEIFEFLTKKSSFSTFVADTHFLRKKCLHRLLKMGIVKQVSLFSGSPTTHEFTAKGLIIRSEARERIRNVLERSSFALDPLASIAACAHPTKNKRFFRLLALDSTSSASSLHHEYVEAFDSCDLESCRLTELFAKRLLYYLQTNTGE
ncbi:hypothetical protein ADUPG1_000121 [Aduncisulcus paluster]|uniref:Uncharacterized protein n=1 Tax=Aduncisulcus paluster TaxID=2918883 RepID=A0ABQ5K524_9EUKA|nr:hypothetical protein ADUPG1_000121 [Aduncisulcus paluster]